MSILELSGVVKRYGQTLALDGITFSVEAGQIVSLLGPSGCGKTTTLRMIAGFEHPDEGTLRIGGAEMRGRRPYERNVGLLFQDYALFPHMSVEENIAYGPRIRRTDMGEVERRVSALLGLTRLAGFEKRRPTELSGGQQQRVALARALATDPQLLLLDEPLSALDAKLRQELQIELKELLVKVGSTTIIVTHDQEEAMALSERVIVMNRGRIEQDGTPSEIYHRPKSRFVAEFIGRSNWFSGTVGEAVGDGTVTFITTTGQALRFPAEAGQAGPVDVCIRPENLLLTPGNDTPPASPGVVVVKGSVATTIPLGAVVHHVVEIEPSGRLLAIRQDRVDMALPPGSPVWVAIDPRDCILVPAMGDAP